MSEGRDLALDALAPFAELARALDDPKTQPAIKRKDLVLYSIAGVGISTTDLRRARTAHERLSKGEKA